MVNYRCKCKEVHLQSKLQTHWNLIGHGMTAPESSPRSILPPPSQCAFNSARKILERVKNYYYYYYYYHHYYYIIFLSLKGRNLKLREVRSVGAVVSSATPPIVLQYHFLCSSTASDRAVKWYQQTIPDMWAHSKPGLQITDFWGRNQSPEECECT
jgi:hypothetical protein